MGVIEMEVKRFTKNDGGFICANCGAEVVPLRYTSRNHCPRCLCSLHLDVNPGDRAADCGGIMDPITAEPDEDADKINGKKRKQLKMNGLIFCYDEQEDAQAFPKSCDAPEMVQSMEHGGSGVFIPAKLKKDGTVAAFSAIASLSRAGVIASSIERMLIEMADELHAGRIGAVPAAGLYDACKYCEYHAVCGHERDDPVRVIRSFSDAEAIEQMKGGEPE